MAITMALRMHLAVPYRVQVRGWLVASSLLLLAIVYARYGASIVTSLPSRLIELVVASGICVAACAIIMLTTPALHRLTQTPLR